MTNIQTTAIRLIANAYLYSREKGKECHGYRFDSSFLTKRDITSIADMEELQKELNKRGWSFTVLNFNDFVIQDKSFLAEMTKLGFGRIEEKTDEEIKKEHLTAVNERIRDRLFEYIKQEFQKDKIYSDVKRYKADEDGLSCIRSFIDVDNGKTISVAIKTTEESSLVYICGVDYGFNVCNYVTKNVKEKFKELYNIIFESIVLRKVRNEIIQGVSETLINYGVHTDTEKSYDEQRGLIIYESLRNSENEEDLGELFRVYRDKSNGDIWVKWKSTDKATLTKLGVENCLTENAIKKLLGKED